MARPKTPIISKQLVIDTALELIDHDGLSALSLRILAERLGVNNGSLYYHYRYKKDILKDVLLYVLRPLDPSSGPLPDWKTYLVERSRTLAALLSQHPNLVDVVEELTPREFGLSVEEQGMQLMHEAGIEPAYAMLIREQIDASILACFTHTYRKPLFADTTTEHKHLTAASKARPSIAVEDSVAISVQAIVDGFERLLELDED